MKYTIWLLAAVGLLASSAIILSVSAGPGTLEVPELPAWPEALALDATAPITPKTPGTTLRGVITRLDGHPAQAAFIQVNVATGTRWAWSDEQGAFALTGLPHDAQVFAALEVAVIAHDHLPATFSPEAASMGPLAKPVNWTLPAPAPDLEALPDLLAADFTGLITRTPGSPEGLEVWFTPPAEAPPLAGLTQRRTRVAADGTFEVPQLTAGAYQVSILPKWAAGGTWPILGSSALAFTPGASMAPLALLEGSIEGRVVDAHGRALAGALLLVHETGKPDRLWPAIASDANGQFAIPELPPGRYQVTLTSGAARMTLAVTTAAGEVSPADFTLPRQP